MDDNKQSDTYWRALLSRTAAILASVDATAATAVPPDVAATIEHTLLAPAATTADIAALCAQARDHGFHSVCVNSAHARQAAASGVRTCVVVGFPLGAMSTEAKALYALHSTPLHSASTAPPGRC